MVEDPDNKPQRPTFGQICKSVLAAAIGVQSEENRQRDFQSKHSALLYIIAGIIFTVLFVLLIVSVVNLVLP